PADKDRLDRVLRSARLRCGQAYARWQELLDRKDGPGLAAFAASEEALRLRSTLVNALARDLTDAGQHAACRAFLRAAVDRYPHDVWLQHDLFINCAYTQPVDWAEALRYASAASVQWPGSSNLLIKVGLCYANLGAYDDAVAVYRKAIALQANPVYPY